MSASVKIARQTADFRFLQNDGKRFFHHFAKIQEITRFQHAPHNPLTSIRYHRAAKERRVSRAAPAGAIGGEGGWPSKNQGERK